MGAVQGAFGGSGDFSLIIGFDSLYKCKTYILEVGVDDIKRIDTLREIRLIQGGLMDKPQCGNTTGQVDLDSLQLVHKRLLCHVENLLLIFRRRSGRIDLSDLWFPLV